MSLQGTAIPQLTQMVPYRHLVALRVYRPVGTALIDPLLKGHHSVQGLAVYNVA